MSAKANSTKRSCQSLLTSYKLLHRLGRPLGLSCYTLHVVNEKPALKVTTLDVVLLFFTAVFNIYLLYSNYEFWGRVSLLHKTDKVFNAGMKFITTGTLFLTMFGSFVSFFMRNHILRIIVTVQDVIDKVGSKNCGLQHIARSIIVLFYVPTPLFYRLTDLT